MRGEHQILQEETTIKPAVLRERRMDREDQTYGRIEK
jgi:hypothetical protein